MDRNYLLRRREEELSWASSATCEAARQAHLDLAEHFKEAAENVGRPAQVADGGERPQPSLVAQH